MDVFDILIQERFLLLNRLLDDILVLQVLSADEDPLDLYQWHAGYSPLPRKYYWQRVR